MKLGHPIVGDILALIAGTLLTLAFAPFKLYWLAILSPAILLSLWLWVSPQRAFWRGWLYGIGLFATGVYWVFISIHTYGNTHALVAFFLTSLFIAILALFPAITGYLLNRLFPTLTNEKLIGAFPALWFLSEWVRSWLFTGFPWLLIGNTQLTSPLGGFAPLFSVFGVSFLVILSSGLLISSIWLFKKREYKKGSLNVCALVLFWIAGAILSTIHWTTPLGQPVRVSLVQGNILQEVKWSPSHIQPTIDRYLLLTEPYWKKSQIIIWPESAIPLPAQNVENLLTALKGQAKKYHLTFMTGIPVRAAQPDAYYNTILSYGETDSFYSKHRLVPFGEYIPLQSWLQHALDFLNIPISTFIPSQVPAIPLRAGDLNISAFICYEIAFAEQVRSPSANIHALLVVSNDGWFGYSIAQAQHLETAQMRALEMQRPVLFVSNNGLTALINSQGEITHTIPPHQANVLNGTIQPMQGRTPWQIFALDPILFIAVGLLIFMLIIQKHFSRKSHDE